MILLERRRVYSRPSWPSTAAGRSRSDIAITQAGEKRPSCTIYTEYSDHYLDRNVSDNNGWTLAEEGADKEKAIKTTTTTTADNEKKGRRRRRRRRRRRKEKVQSQSIPSGSALKPFVNK